MITWPLGSELTINTAAVIILNFGLSKRWEYYTMYNGSLSGLFEKKSVFDFFVRR